MGKITPVASSSKPTTAGVGEGGGAAAWLNEGGWPPNLKAAVKSLDSSREDTPVERFRRGREGLRGRADESGGFETGKMGRAHEELPEERTLRMIRLSYDINLFHKHL